MANAADITINDGAATPVAVSFKVVKASPELTIWKDRRLARPTYWPEITLSADLPSVKAKIRQPELRVALPVIDPITGLVTDYLRFRGTFDIPVNAVATDVNNIYAYASNAIVNALIKGASRDLDTIVG